MLNGAHGAHSSKPAWQPCWKAACCPYFLVIFLNGIRENFILHNHDLHAGKQALKCPEKTGKCRQAIQLENTGISFINYTFSFFSASVPKTARHWKRMLSVPCTTCLLCPRKSTQFLRHSAEPQAGPVDVGRLSGREPRLLPWRRRNLHEWTPGFHF